MSQRARGVIGVGGGRIGVFRLDQYTSLIGANLFFSKGGQAEFLTAGTYTWVCPAGVTSVSVVCVGGGGGGYSSWASSAGGGGGLGYKNNIPVVPGQSYTVVVGAGGGRNGSGIGWAGGNSYFISLATVSGYGGGNATAGVTGSAYLGTNANGSGGGWVGDGGGAGGNADNTGGGGAGGYAGNGGASSTNATANTGAGAGGGCYSSTWGTGGGGGVGIYGIRTDYTAQANYAYNTGGTSQGAPEANDYGPSAGLGGQGGSRRTGTISGQFTGWGGQQGQNAVGWSSGVQIQTNIQGGFPGGGGGGPGSSGGGGNGGGGAVRIMWGGERTGENRAYPNTNTLDVT